MFRDDAALAIRPSLWSDVRDKLDASRFLVLLASPAAADSRWVDLELRHWLVGIR